MASSGKEIRPSDGSAGGSVAKKSRRKALTPEQLEKRKKRRQQLRAKRMWQEARKHYLAMIIVLVVCAYLASRAFGVFQLGDGIFNRYTAKTDTLAACPTTDKFDGSITIAEYVGVGTQASTSYANNHDGGNLYQNSQFDKTNDDGSLASFEQAEAVDYAKLQVGQDADGTRYVRSTVGRATDAQVGKTWLPNFAPITPNRDYHFTFQYRSDVRADVLVQFQKADGSFEYRPVYELLSSNGWRTVEGKVSTDGADYTAGRVIVTPKAMGYVDISRPGLYLLKSKQLAGGILSVAFDDGWKSVYEQALPLLNKHGIKTTQFVVPAFAQTDTQEYMSFTQIKKMQQAGNEIASHSYRHCDQTLLSQADLKRDIVKTTDLLTKNGVNDIHGFAYPYGVYTAVAQEAVRSQYGYVRTSNDGYNDYYADRSLLMVKSVESTTTTAQVSEWLKFAREHKLWVILLYHQVEGPGAYSTKAADFDAQMNAVSQSGLQILTVGEAVKRLPQ